jgi:hypothetical protein
LVIAFAGALLAATPTWAGKADVLTVEARQTDAEQWTFVVTVQHDGSSALGGLVAGADGRGHRARPPRPAPFPRGRAALQLGGRDPGPRGVQLLVVEAHDKVHGLGGKTVTVDLTKPAGPGYTVRPLR